MITVAASALPVYTHREQTIGTAVLLALCALVIAALALSWWRRR